MGRHDMPQYRLKHSPMEMVYSLFHAVVELGGGKTIFETNE
jgi:hypothetical protein